MPIKIEMPRLSDTMEEGTLLKWHVAVGDTVEAGQEIADIETDKATMALQVFDDGKIAKLMTDEGGTLAVGETIAVLAEDGESVEDAAAAAGDGSGGDTKTDAPQEKEAADAEDVHDTVPKPTPSGVGGSADGDGESGGTSGGGRVRISPLAQKLADEHGIDIQQIQGSGPSGRIIKRDILAAAEGGGTKPTPSGVGGPSAPPPIATPSAGLESKQIKLSNMRKTIAKRLVESKTTIPHFTVSVAVAADALLDLRKTINAQLEPQGVKLSVNDFITRATALAALQHPAVNSSWAGDAIQQHGQVNVGIAISLPEARGGGLVVATLRDVPHLGLRQISEQTRTLAGKARDSGLSVDEMSDATITVSNLGMPQFGVTQFTAIINPPNAAILAIGAAIQKPVVRDGQLAIGHEMTITLSGDHRVIDGASAAEYLTTLRSLLENPASILV
jgi:pyruvate dehydrogenase E2 component (dihydrolipoamide acetyltransferase)